MEMFTGYSDEDSDDEWFFGSIKRYDDLLIYDVQGQVSCMCFCDDKTLILAVSRGTVNELWEVKVPDKLLVAGKNSGLYKNRDFTLVAAGYINHPVGEVVCTGDGVVTSGPTGVILYTRNATDVMNLASSLRNDVKNATLAISLHTVYSGETLSNIAVSDLTSYLTENISIQPKYDSNRKQEISRMSVIHDNLCVGLRDRGTVLVYDTKAGSLRCSVEASEICTDSGRWGMDVSQDGKTVALANSAGSLSVHDTRKLHQPLFTWTQDETELSSSPEVHFSPVGSQISLSGSGKLVQVIDCDNVVEGNRTVFIHDGHRSHNVKRVVHHLWHPTQEQLLFSADDDSKVQAWRYR